LIPQLPGISSGWLHNRMVLLLLGGLVFAAGGITAWTIVQNRFAADHKLQVAIAPQAATHEKRPQQFVARLTVADGCRWLDEQGSPQAGGELAVGQTLHLASGVVEIRFDVGARVVLQGPASFAIESPTSARLTMGKLTVEILAKEAHGFTVHTAAATFVDLGTEFGVEVSPDGASRVHVFQGEVNVALNSGGSKEPLLQRLPKDFGARFDGDNPQLMRDTGESFVRSLDRIDRDRHIVAYWRFEEHPVGNVVPHTRRNTAPIRGTLDSSFNGNDLFSFASQNQPHFSSAVPAKVVPQTGQSNTGCLDNSPLREWATRDVYTRSAFSHASPVDIQKITPTQWTIEASVKATNWRHGVQTFVGRDGAPALPVVDVPPRLAFQVTAEGRFAIRFRDENGRLHEAVARDFELAQGHWYHVAAVSDGRILSLYANALDGRGYQLIAKNDLPTSGSTALGNGSNDAEWSVGRGKVAGKPDQWFQGWIDEVRICDDALEPAEFLFAKDK
jgi:hypothetical protein